MLQAQFAVAVSVFLHQTQMTVLNVHAAYVTPSLTLISYSTLSLNVSRLAFTHCSCSRSSPKRSIYFTKSIRPFRFGSLAYSRKAIHENRASQLPQTCNPKTRLEPGISSSSFDLGGGANLFSSIASTIVPKSFIVPATFSGLNDVSISGFHFS